MKPNLDPEYRWQLTDFIKTVEEMRKTQRLYFRTRKDEDLVEAKRLEAACDVRLAGLVRK